MIYGNSNNTYNTYREVGVKTASQGKLVVMLYDGAVSHLQDAMALIAPNGKIAASNIEAFGNHVQKAQDIITELQISLDMEKGGEIAQNLMSLYIYFNKELLTASIRHDKTKLSFVSNMLGELRDSWASAAASQANSAVKMPVDRPTISVIG